MPAYNAEKTLEYVYKKIPKDWYDEIILVDDNSKDNTYREAKRLGIESYKNKKNVGYGGNLKVCFEKALRKGADIIVELHPDGEYDPSAINPAVAKIIKGAGLVLGNRFAHSPLSRGMYTWKYIPSKILSLIQAKILNIPISDLHQGFRAYSRKLLEGINFRKNSNNYLFSFEVITQAVYLDMKISQVPVICHYEGKKRGASLTNSVLYTMGTFDVLALFLLSKYRIIRHHMFRGLE